MFSIGKWAEIVQPTEFVFLCCVFLILSSGKMRKNSKAPLAKLKPLAIKIG